MQTEPNGNGSELVALLERAKNAAWDKWWSHAATRFIERRDDHRRLADRLWAEFEECAAAYHCEIDSRSALAARLNGRAAA